MSHSCRSCLFEKCDCSPSPIFYTCKGCSFCQRLNNTDLSINDFMMEEIKRTLEPNSSNEETL